MEITRHFTATTFVVFQNRTVLHFHKTLKMWLPPGGHIDRDERPDHAALREVKEETGLDVTLVYDPPKIASENAIELPPPRHILLENINPYHQHIDLIYFARAHSEQLKPHDGESTTIRWFTEEDLADQDLTEDVRTLAKTALQVVSALENA
ncbi:MAG: NUDIX domain-containing protein [Candidatus Marinimicrobia bacterium]|nr:NUDIX domain-containing protein [Candidatus Neomarinimicrobiota bacterium]MCF7839353.1 NUDIX domain-containing protein [Candidatus Neomarinimicrobiota bacterium]MCF7901956.1 NUDIX domain-containing protein [Candidatus Neomarinimicrobiota bacterium]